MGLVRACCSRSTMAATSSWFLGGIEDVFSSSSSSSSSSPEDEHITSHRPEKTDEDLLSGKDAGVEAVVASVALCSSARGGGGGDGGESSCVGITALSASTRDWNFTGTAFRF